MGKLGSVLVLVLVTAALLATGCPPPKDDVIDTSKITGKLYKTWADFDVWEDGEKGMRIHAKFEIEEAKGTKGEVISYFFFNVPGEKPLKDFNGKYATGKGNVAVTKAISLKYDRAVFDDFQMFIPYKELHVDTSQKSHTLKFDMWILIGTTKILQSEFITFTINL